jgi:hypothetical protein
MNGRKFWKLVDKIERNDLRPYFRYHSWTDHSDGQAWDAFKRTARTLRETAPTYNDYGDSCTRYITVAAKNVVAAIAHAREVYPSERCRHAHDCCGNWYCSDARLVRRTKRREWLFAVGWQQNV